MEQHPVPQNVTTFEFKLIGDMTVRQFIYLAAGVFVGYVFFSMRWPDIIRLPLTFFAGFIGFALAFMPIEERPLDRWFLNFVKSVYGPTQFIWQKSPQVPEFWNRLIPKPQTTTAPLPYLEMRQKLDDYLKTLPREPKNALDQAETALLASLNLGEVTSTPATTPYSPPLPLITSNGVKVHRLHAVDFQKQGVIFPFAQKIVATTLSTKLSSSKQNIPPEDNLMPQKSLPAGKATAPTNLSIGPGGIITKVGATPLEERPAAQPATQTDKGIDRKTIKTDLAQQNEELKKQITGLQMQIQTLKTQPIPETMTAKDFDAKIKELVEKMAEAEKERQKKEKELIGLRRQLSEHPQERPAVRPQFEETTPTRRQPTAKYIADKVAQQKGIPVLTTTPNIISGIVASGTGDILPSVIIIVKDKSDNPVRALKTNKVGQFMTSTPLENGVYQIELEKEGFQFDIIEVELNGGILPPLEIKAK